MSLFLDGEKGEGGEATTTAATEWCWSRVSPNHLEHTHKLPTAITLHRLVPRSLSSGKQTAAATSTFKYITPEEIKAAQIKARQEILASRLSPPIPLASDTPSQPPPQNKKHHHKKDISGPQSSFSCRLGSGEAGLRRRQLTRLVSQISRTIIDLRELNKPCQRDFVAPLHLEIETQRWNACARLMRRSLFVLKQEVVILERENGPGIRNSRHLRGLAAAARTLNTQLLTLKSQAESISGDLPWTEVLKEFVGVARRMLVLAVRVGVQSPPSSVKWATLPQEEVVVGSENSSSLESVISISEVDSTNIHILQSGHVKDRLAKLATLHLNKRKKQKSKKVTMTARRKTRPDIVLEPLKRQLDQRGSTSLDTAAAHQYPPNPSLFKRGDDSTTGVTSAPKNTSQNGQSEQALPKTTSAGPQSHDSTHRTNNPALLQTQPSLTQTNNAPISQPQLPLCQNNFPASDTNTNSVPQASLMSPNVTQQLSFFLQRICKIEDTRRRTESLIAEASQVIDSQRVTPSLGDAVQRARLVLAAVRGTAPQPVPSVANFGITGGDSLPKTIGLSIKVPEGVPSSTSSGAVDTHHFSEKVENPVSSLEGQWLAGRSVIEQVRQQKEQFWLSLAKQGFVRPPEILPLTGDKMGCSNQPVSNKSFHKNILEEGDEEKFRRKLKKNAVNLQSHQQTQTAEQYQPSSKSDSISEPSHYTPATKKTHHSPSDSQVKLDDLSGDTKQSVSTEDQIEQTVSVETTSSGMPTSTETESQTFPSYEGLSNPA